MNRTVLGAFATLLLVAAGLFWWQGRAAIDPGKLPQLALAAPTDGLPSADGRGLHGPALPAATEETKEQRRFDRFDKNRDNRITRTELLAPRAAAFRKLDVDGNNLLTFEEWAVRTSNKFKDADGNGDGALDRVEYTATKPKPKLHPQCKCAGPATKGKAAPARTAPEPEPEPELDDDGDPAG